MGLFSNLLSKVLGGSHTAVVTPATSGLQSVKKAVSPQTGAQAIAPAGVPATPAATAPVVDVSAILDGMAASNSEKLDWKRSIVDLMKLVGMDSSLATRRELAKELHYPGDTSDSAAMNIWLHKEVIKKFAENGGKVPKDLLD